MSDKLITTNPLSVAMYFFSLKIFIFLILLDGSFEFSVVKYLKLSFLNIRSPFGVPIHLLLNILLMQILLTLII